MRKSSIDNKARLAQKLALGMWAGIGGHMNLQDIENPRDLDFAASCCREIYEKTGNARQNIYDLKLKYIAVRKIDGENRFHYQHIGHIKTEFPLLRCDEGELHWVDKSEIHPCPKP